MERDWPGQLVVRSEHGHLFKHDPGAKGGKVYDEDGKTLLGTFLFVDAGDEDTPTGVYIAGLSDGTNYTYADTYDGASAFLLSKGDPEPVNPKEAAATIAREINRLEASRERDYHRMGSTRRQELDTRVKALRWALHVLLTGQPTEPPGETLERFLWAHRDSEEWETQ